MQCIALHIYACGVMKCHLIIISQKLTENVNTLNGLDHNFYSLNQNSIKHIFTKEHTLLCHTSTSDRKHTITCLKS